MWAGRVRRRISSESAARASVENDRSDKRWYLYAARASLWFGLFESSTEKTASTGPHPHLLRAKSRTQFPFRQPWSATAGAACGELTVDREPSHDDRFALRESLDRRNILEATRQLQSALRALANVSLEIRRLEVGEALA